MDVFAQRYLDVLADRLYIVHDPAKNIIRTEKCGTTQRQVVGVKCPKLHAFHQSKGHAFELESKSSSGTKCRTFMCHNDGVFTCTGCETANYCSVSHQEEDWKRHKKECRIYSLKESQKVNIGLYPVVKVSQSHQQIGRVILEEEPLVIVPQIPTKDDYQICIDCCQKISDENSAVCTDCHWPVCDEAKCDPKISLHSDEECKWLTPLRKFALWRQRIGYVVFRLLRILILKKTTPLIYELLLRMGKKRRQNLMSTRDSDIRTYYIQWLRYFHKLKEIDYSDEEIGFLWNVLRLNTVDLQNNSVSNINDTVPQRKAAMMIYWEGSLYPHSCYPNTSYEVSHHCQLLVSCQFPVQVGHVLTMNYDITSTYQPTKYRQDRLMKYHKIRCSCIRCSDPSEFQTWFSAIPCHAEECYNSKGQLGFLVYGQLNEKYPQGSWKCSKCHTIVPDIEVKCWLSAVEKGFNKYLDQIEDGILQDGFETPDKLNLNTFVKVVVKNNVLHETNYLIFQYSVHILKLLYRNLTRKDFQQSLNNSMKDDYTQLKILCQFLSEYSLAANSVYKILNAFLPPYSDLNGIVPRMVALIKMVSFIKAAKKQQQINRKNEGKACLHLDELQRFLERYVICIHLKDKKEEAISVRDGPLDTSTKGSEKETMDLQLLRKLVNVAGPCLFKDEDKNSVSQLNSYFRGIKNYFSVSGLSNGFQLEDNSSEITSIDDNF